jgi:hypothetical protein
MQTTIQLLYKTISGNKKKERFETILEPLQALIQIALLSYYPIGTKLTIQNNILYIQAPSYGQSVARWYNNDTQEDLFYLFNIFCRFKKFYIDVKTEHIQLFTLLIELAKHGISNLIRTYNQTDKTHVLHTLQMYKNMLDSSSSNNSIATIQLLPSSSSSNHNNFDNIHNNNHNNNHNKVNNESNERKNKINRGMYRAPAAPIISLTEKEKENEKEKEMTSFSSSVPVPVPVPVPASSASSASSEIDMDDIFIKISDLYNDEMFKIIYNIFIAMKGDETNYIDYANGLNAILHPINIKIKKWIDENIVF